MIRGLDALQFTPVLKEGVVYLIEKLWIMKYKNNFNVLPRDLMIVLSRITKLKDAHEDITAYPSYHFNCADYNTLHDRIYQKKVLTGMISNKLDDNTIFYN